MTGYESKRAAARDKLKCQCSMTTKLVGSGCQYCNPEYMKAEIEVTDCRDCPYAKDHRGHGECWKYCSHPKHGQRAYGDILWGCGAEFKAVPEWCPIKEKNT